MHHDDPANLFTPCKSHTLSTLYRPAPECLPCLRARVEELEAAIPEGCTPADAQVLRAANHALAAERDEALARVAELEAMPEGWRVRSLKLEAVEKERDRYMRAMVHIRSNAESQLHAQAFAGTPEDAPEAINARWNYTEANAALSGA